MTCKRITMLAAALAATLVVGHAAAQAAFAVRLSTVPVDQRNRPQTTGHGTASASLEGRELRLSGSFEGLQGGATAAHVHVGPATGVRGPVIAEIEVAHATNGSLSGTLELSRAQVEALRSGRLYLQIDSESAPEGNLWGWLLP